MQAVVACRGRREKALQDNEFRIIVTGQGGKAEAVAIFACDPDGVWSMCDAWEIGPFDVWREIFGRISLTMRRHLTLVTRLR